jgi:hypothetical protein
VQWFDVGFGWGDETPIGFRAGIGLDADKTEVTGVPDTKNGANVFSIQGGITFNETTDVTAEVSIGTSEADSLDGSVNQFAAGIRGYYEMAEMEWGYLGAVAVAGEDEDITPTSKNENSITQFMAGWGPVWNDESEDWQAAGYMTVEVQSQKFEPFGPDNNQDDRFVTFPGFRFAGEHRLKSWLWVRGGARSDYFWHRTEDEGVPVPGSSTETKNRLYDFQWTAGLSAEWGGFRFDGAINEPWVNNGPSFIGQDSQLFAFASATYNWGGEPESR